MKPSGLETSFIERLTKIQNINAYRHTSIFYFSLVLCYNLPGIYGI